MVILRFFSKRLRIWFSILWKYKAQKILLIIYSLGAAYSFIARELLPGMNLPTISKLMPNWGWYYWVILGLLILLIATVEGLYRKQRDRASDNWILDYFFREGKLPTLPKYMHPAFPNYSGTPITKDLQTINISGQFWNSLLPVRRKALCTVWEWLGKDPNDFLQSLKQTHPDISLDLGDGDKDGWKSKA